MKPSIDDPASASVFERDPEPNIMRNPDADRGEQPRKLSDIKPGENLTRWMLRERPARYVHRTYGYDPDKRSFPL